MSAASERLYTAAQVRQLDAVAIEGRGIPGYDLMCRAGAAVVEQSLAAFSDCRRWLVLCGAGNNGGDGYVVARLAREQGREVRVIALKDPESLSGDAARAVRDWHAAGGATEPWGGALPEADLLIDALLGTGLDRDVGGPWREAIEAANGLGCPITAVDVPSGLDADTGRRRGAAIRAELTVTFIGRKRGVYTADGPDCAGWVVFDPLGTPADIHDEIDGGGRFLTQADLARALAPRPRNSHKGAFGHVLVVGGNRGMSGAARLAGEAALRSGAGLVTLATHAEHAAAINASRPELMVRAVAGADDLEAALERATVLALGPGLGQDRWARDLFERVLEEPRPVVVDADGLNLLARAPRKRHHWVLTPHPGEASRLLACSTAEIQADRFAAAAAIAERYGATVALKGCGTVLAEPGGAWAICPLGNPGMASGGSGDVLTGVIAGLLAQGLEAWPAGGLGVTAHAAAGDHAARAGERGLLAGDIVACLPEVLNPVPPA